METFRLSQVAERLLCLDGKPFSLHNYPMYRTIYDGRYQSTLLMCGRQVAKTLVISSTCSMHDGSLKTAGEVVVGDVVASMLPDGVRMGSGRVRWVSHRYFKECLRVTTRQGHTVEVATTHPMRIWGAWRVAGELSVGDRIAAVRQCGVFSGIEKRPGGRIRLTAYLLGDGHLGAKYFGFTSLPGSKMDEFVRDVESLGGAVRIRRTKGRAFQLSLRRNDTPLRAWITEDGLLDTRSHTKFLPPWVFGLSREDTALFINRLWSTDGHAKRHHARKYTLEYYSTSFRLISELRALLWKFKIPTGLRTWVPKKGKRAYKIRIETQDGVYRFLKEIGAIGKTEGMPLPQGAENNNRDTFPLEINVALREIIASRGPDTRMGRAATHSLRSAGLRETLKYPPTRKGLAAYVAFFEADTRYDRRLVAALKEHLNTDLYWDEIVSIHAMGQQECVDFEVAKTHNFIANGLVTHNSTSWANFIIAESISLPFFKSYYVSPSKEQTLIFSNTRLGKVLAYSPLIKTHFQSPEHADRVLHRSYTNGSENAFTYACDDADRARGFSADRVLYDEIQDMIYDAVVPVINECMSASKYGKYESYAGTPKTMESSIQFLWDRSSKTEWVMKCQSCNSYNYIETEKSVGLNGPVCLKCGHVLNPRDGFWMDTNQPDPDPTRTQIKGFHIPQLIMPENVPCACPSDLESQERATKNWRAILNKMPPNYSPARFRNEVLGVSDAQGARLISLDELRALCTGPSISPTLNPKTNGLGVAYTVAGVDWSGGGTKGVSRTVLWIWGFVPSEQKLRTLYYKVFPGTSAVADVQEIRLTCAAYNVAIVVGDAGEGALPNSYLRAALGSHRVTMMNYSGAMTHKLVSWNGTDRYVCHRTTMIDNYLMFLKQQGAVLPPYAESKVAIDDILNIYEEVTTAGQKIWTHSPQLPDDCLHAQLFGWFAWKIHRGDLKMYQ